MPDDDIQLELQKRTLFDLTIRDNTGLIFKGSATPPDGARQFEIQNVLTREMLGEQAFGGIVSAIGGTAVVTISADGKSYEVTGKTEALK